MDSEVVVVIVNYNTVEHVKRCITSLRTEPVDRILVYDNDSSDAKDGSFELQSLPELDERVSVLTSERNLGFGGAVNRAVEAAALVNPRDCLWILNPDTVVREGCVDALKKTMDSDAEVISSPMVWSMIPGSAKAWYAGGEYDVARGRVRHWTEARSAETYSTGYMTGAAPFLSLGTWRKVGGFRDDLFMYWEDADWSLRARQKGIELVVVPGAEIEHAVGGSTASDGERSRLYYFYTQRNRIVVSRSFGVALVRLVFAKETLRLLARPIKNERTDRKAKVAASLRGIVAGIRMAERGPAGGR